MKFKLCIFALLLIGFSTLDFIGDSSKKIDLSNIEKMVIAVDTLPPSNHIKIGESTGYQLELLKLYSEKINISFETIPVGNAEERLAMLKDGKADIAIFSEGLDSLRSLLPLRKEDICYSIPMDDKTQSVWMVKSGNEQIISSINSWVCELKETQEYKLWQLQYFDPNYFGKKGKISSYDHWFKKYSAEIGWDWRLLAAICYQESRFNPQVESPRGAYGLMQVMPETAEYIGVTDIEHPENNIRAGVKLIKWLQRQIDKREIPEEERLSFILSAYNAGLGRIEDCRSLARSLGKDPDKWDDIVEIIPLMNEPEYYQSEFIRHGKFKGVETLYYVNQVLDRYQHYKDILPSL